MDPCYGSLFVVREEEEIVSVWFALTFYEKVHASQF